MSTPLTDMVGSSMQAAQATVMMVPVDYQYKSIFSRKVFSFAMRRADFNEWGLVYEADEHDKSIVVRSVVSRGAIDAWNKMGVALRKTDRLVLPGDKIIRVNGITDDTSRMAREFGNRQLVQLTIVRNDVKVLPVCMPLVPMPSISE